MNHPAVAQILPASVFDYFLYFNTSGKATELSMAIPKILEAEFILSAPRPEQFPKSMLPEVAFWGRSNVGKSSLINTLLHRKNLVRTSSRPGCTQTINYFLINQKWYFVDLPGFWYS